MTENVTNPLLARVRMPGQRVTLPSGGLFYADGELDPSVVGGEIEVQPMTMIDDLVLKTPDKLLNGDGIVEVISRCIPQVLKPWELLSKDVDFLVICLRIVTYGNLVELTHAHEGCSKEFKKDNKVIQMERSYKVDVSKLLKKTRRIDPTTLNDVFCMTLTNGQIIKTKPMTFRMFVHVMQLQLNDIETLQVDDSFNNMVDMLSNIILEVDEVTNREHIKEWLQVAPPKIVGELNERLVATFDWGSDLSDNVVCHDCGQLTELVVPIDPLSFFS